MSLFSFITDINGFFEIPNPPPFTLSPPFIKFNKHLRPPFCFDPPPSPFFRHLRVNSVHIIAKIKVLLEIKEDIYNEISELKTEFST